MTGISRPRRALARPGIGPEHGIDPVVSDGTLTIEPCDAAGGGA